MKRRRSRPGRLSRKQEAALARRIAAGDAAAREKLILANQGMVVTIAIQFKKYKKLPLDDLIQEGNLGLIRACHTFKPAAHKASFAGYAQFWVRSYIVRAVLNDALVRIPMHARAVTEPPNPLPLPDRDELVDESSLETPEQSAQEIVSEAMRYLDPIEAWVLTERYVKAVSRRKPRAYQAIGEKCGLSPPRVEELVSAAKVRLRQLFDELSE
jgi:RNA polymerase sigma factor (sigma-70 family)